LSLSDWVLIFFKNKGVRRMRDTERVALVDIDNTLWDFASVLYEELVKVVPDIPSPEKWYEWDFWRNHIEAELFFDIINRIHRKQDMYSPFPDTRGFLESLREIGFRIVIASQRDSGTMIPTVRWFLKHRLPFDDIFLVNTKSFLVERSTVVVDDSPMVLKESLNKRKPATGLAFPWNSSLVNQGAFLFDSLDSISDWIRNFIV